MELTSLLVTVEGFSDNVVFLLDWLYDRSRVTSYSILLKITLNSY